MPPTPPRRPTSSAPSPTTRRVPAPPGVRAAGDYGPGRRRPRRVWDAVGERLALGTKAPRSLRPPRMSEGDRRVLGRDNACDFRIADTTVSSRHAELVRISDGWLIRDLHSRNGTRVNGWLIDEHELRPGDTITLGSSVFLFRPPSPA